MGVTIKDVAEYAETSVATVSHVINDTRYVSSELERKVKEAMEELNYRPNRLARSLKTNQTRSFGLLISDITNPHFCHLVKGVEDIASEQNYRVVISNTNENAEKQAAYADLLLEEAVDAMIVAPVIGADDSIKEINTNDLSLVLVDRTVNQINANAVLSDNIDGARKATEHLINQGHEKIGIVLGLKGLTTTQERLKGYKEALENHKIPFIEKNIAYGKSRTKRAEKAIKSLLTSPNRPTALFSTSNLMTIGAMNAIKQVGMECPKDISVVGFDDFKWASAFKPALTTVEQNPYKMGCIAARLALEGIEEDGGGSKEVRVETELIVRNSVKAI